MGFSKLLQSLDRSVAGDVGSGSGTGVGRPRTTGAINEYASRRFFVQDIVLKWEAGRLNPNSSLN